MLMSKILTRKCFCILFLLIVTDKLSIPRATRDNILYQMRTFSGGRNTVPQIFFNAEHLGGNDDVQKLDQEGKLVEKVEKVKTTQVTMMQDHWYHPWY
jgi:glutaredoxin